MHHHYSELPPSLAACSFCALGKLCFPRRLPDFCQVLFPLADKKRIKLTPGELLFQAGSLQSSLYAIKAGFLKTCMQLPDGKNKISGFHLMGDALGLDALGTGTHGTSAIALNGCEVCVIPIEKFEKLLDNPSESTHARQLLSREIARAETHAAIIGALSARQRVAAFLLDLSARWEYRGYSKNEFALFMSRKEIGSFLGLTFETVSRVLSYFQSKKWIVMRGKNILIKDLFALQTQIAHAA